MGRACDQDIAGFDIALHHFPIGGGIGGKNAPGHHRPDDAENQAIDMLMGYQSDNARARRNLRPPKLFLHCDFCFDQGEGLGDRFGIAGRAGSKEHRAAIGCGGQRHVAGVCGGGGRGEPFADCCVIKIQIELVANAVEIGRAVGCRENYGRTRTPRGGDCNQEQAGRLAMDGDA